jgi:dolichyl-phosphate-mannose-protein mannosyltransferase
MSFIILIAAAGVLGGWTLRACGESADAEGIAYRMLAGLCLCAVIVMVLGSGSLRAAYAVVVAVAAIGLAYEIFFRLPRRSAAQVTPTLREPFSLFERFCIGISGVSLTLSLIAAFAPVTSWDAGVAHLAVPAAFVREGRLHAYEGNAYSAYPILLHTLFAFALFQGGETAATLVAWLFACAGTLAAYALGARLAGRRAGLIAAAGFSTMPIFFAQAATPAVDLPVAAVLLAALAAYAAWRDGPRPGLLVLCALFAGSACGIRHTAYVLCVILFVAIILAAKNHRGQAALVFGGVTLLAAAPWLLRSYLVSGNPIYPFFTHLFAGSSIADAPMTLAAHESIRSRGIFNLLVFPWRIIMWPERYDGWAASPGPIPLLLGVPGLFIAGRRARELGVMALAGIIALYFFRHHARYLLPFFAPLLVVGAAAACRLEPLRKAIAVLLVFIFAYGLVIGAATHHFKAPFAIGVEDREAYLARRVERYAAFEWVNTNVPPRHTVLSFDPRAYYLRGRSFINPEALKPLVNFKPEERLAWLRERDIRNILYPREYAWESPVIRQTGLLDVIEQWRDDKDHFYLLQTIETPRRYDPDPELVEIYEIHYGP